MDEGVTAESSHPEDEAMIEASAAASSDDEAATARLAFADRVLSGDEACAVELGTFVLPPSDDAGSVAALVALCPGAPAEAVGRFLRVLGGDAERCAEWLLEAASLPQAAAAEIARGIAADPAAAVAGAGGVGLARSLAPSAALTTAADAAAAAGAAVGGEPGGAGSVEAADAALCGFVGRREAERLRLEAQRAERRGEALTRVLRRYDERSEALVDAKTQRKLSRRGAALTIDGVPMTATERSRAARKARRKERDSVVRYRDGRTVHVKAGDKFV